MTSNSPPRLDPQAGLSPSSSGSSPSANIRDSPSSITDENLSPKLLLRHYAPWMHLPADADDKTLWRMFFSIMEPPKRSKLPQYNTLQDAIELIRSSRNIVVLSGAGISTSAGIPDFRSRNGIYVQIHEKYPDLDDPKCMFDISYFKKNPLPFYHFARALFPGQYEPTTGHRFIKCIEQHGKLLRNYSQNIDTLERQAGIRRVVECHGSFAKATCTSCGYCVDGDVIKHDVLTQTVPKCPKCHDQNSSRCTDDLAVMKPNIVFFGEELGDEFHKSLEADKGNVDLLIVIGSSLKVRPVALIPRSIPASVPQILINREPLDHMRFDIELLGDCDNVIHELCLRLGGDWTQVCGTKTSLSTEIIGIPADTGNPNGESCSQSTRLARDESENECAITQKNDFNNVDVTTDGADDDEDDWEDVEILDGSRDSSDQEWQAKVSVQIPEKSFIFIKPNTYLFQGVELTKSQLDDYIKSSG